jgi:hypothetical protein
MKTHLTIVLALALLCCAGPASAQPFRFDEFGFGEFGPGFLGPDPATLPAIGPIGLPVALIYPLPYAGTQGDVLFFDGFDHHGVFDVVRFNGDGTLIFYSDNVDVVSPADTGLPPCFYPNLVAFEELGNEEEGGILYTPLPGDPGYDSAFTPVYDLRSEGMFGPTPPNPEPGKKPAKTRVAVLARGQIPKPEDYIPAAYGHTIPLTSNHLPARSPEMLFHAAAREPRPGIADESNGTRLSQVKRFLEARKNP